mgnify:CR=1 FL=1|tara:strand:+ start:98 stop:301 length:204 start_codon:yes stop_codon:yes gene_type:complete
MKYTTSIHDIYLSFDYARISNDGTMSIEFMNNTRHKSRQTRIAKMSKSHADYVQTLSELKEAGALWK